MIQKSQIIQTSKMSKQRLSRDYRPNQIFRVELSAEEMNYLANRLPPGYSLVLQPKKNIPKHVIEAARKRAAAYQIQDSSSLPVNQAKSQSLNKKNVGAVVNQNKLMAMQKLGTQKNVTNNKWVETVNQGMKKAAKILVQLKSHKSSWPFLEPVDANALQIPEYYQIIKEPMDLKTVEQKIKTGKYIDFNQFQQDIMKIIENSYRFNEANEDYLKITSQFENHFTKLSSEAQDKQNVTKNNNKKKKKSSIANKQFSDSVPVTLMEKKLLAQQIRRLAKQHIKGIKSIVFDHPDVEQDVFDLQKLSQKKLRELQKYVRNRIIAMEERNRNTLLQKNQISNFNMCESDESSFLTDSAEE